jgi:hypothetical protein
LVFFENICWISPRAKLFSHFAKARFFVLGNNSLISWQRAKQAGPARKKVTTVPDQATIQPVFRLPGGAEQLPSSELSYKKIL